MIYGVYSIYDRKTLSYMPPFFGVTDGAAIRMVKDSLGPNSSLSRHPTDYVLFKVARFDDQDGTMFANVPVEHVVDIVALLEKAEQADLFGLASTTTMTGAK